MGLERFAASERASGPDARPDPETGAVPRGDGRSPRVPRPCVASKRQPARRDPRRKSSPVNGEATQSQGCRGRSVEIGLVSAPWLRYLCAALDRAHGPAERWQSGRMHRTRNAAYSQGYRGFESPPLRHLRRMSKSDLKSGSYKYLPWAMCPTIVTHNSYSVIQSQMEATPALFGSPARKASFGRSFRNPTCAVVVFEVSPR